MSEKNQSKWADHYFLGMACEAAKGSPDNSTKCGACLLLEDARNPGKDRIHVDCNRFSTLSPATFNLFADDLLTDRSKKLAWIEHAERNVLFGALSRGHDVRGSTMFAPWAACTDCARAIVLLGVKELVRTPKAVFTQWHPIWKDSIDMADEILARGGVIVTEYDGPALGQTMFINKTEREV